MPNDETAKELTPWERFVEATKRVLAVPKDELDRREKAWKKRRATKKRGAS